MIAKHKVLRVTGVPWATEFIAVDAIDVVFGGLIRVLLDVIGWKVIFELGNDGSAGNWIGLAVFVALGVFLWWDARRAQEAEGAEPEISL